VAVWAKSTPNVMKIPCHSSRFYYFSMLEHDMDFEQAQIMAISEAFAKKMMGFPSDLVSCLTKLPSKRQEKSASHFLQGYDIFMW